MLFSREPKRYRDEFFDREEELSLLTRALEVGEGLVIVYGIRRIGKTSLVLVCLNSIGFPYVFIDVRRFVENPCLLSPSGLRGFIESVFERYRGCRKGLVECIKSVARYVESIDTGVLSIRIRRSAREELFTDLLARIDEWASSRGLRFVIVFDEAQYLSIVSQWRNIIAWSIDYLDNVSFIVTSSEVGVLRDFLALDDPGSPLYGRPRVELLLDRLSSDKALEFLEQGFSIAGVSVTRDELVEAVRVFDGIIGWLNLYGYYRVAYRLGHREAIKRIEDDASKLIASELEKLVKHSPKRYLAVLKALALGLTRWSDIKRYVTGFIGYIPDTKTSTNTR